MVMCRRAVLQCCLLKDFYFLPFSTWKKSRILSRTRGNSIFLSFHFVFFLKTGSNEAILVCYVTGAPEKEGLKAEIRYFNKAFAPLSPDLTQMGSFQRS